MPTTRLNTPKNDSNLIRLYVSSTLIFLLKKIPLGEIRDSSHLIITPKPPKPPTPSPNPQFPTPAHTTAQPTHSLTTEPAASLVQRSLQVGLVAVLTTLPREIRRQDYMIFSH